MRQYDSLYYYFYSLKYYAVGEIIIWCPTEFVSFYLKRNKQSLIFNGSFHFNGQNETKYLRVADNQQPYLSVLMLAIPYLEKKGTLGTLMLTYFPP